MTRKTALILLAASLLGLGLDAPLSAQLPLPSLPGVAPDNQATTPAIEPATDFKQEHKEIAERLRVAQRQLEVEKERQS